jgi:diketogulonate reductase-like aldo/keto reductase
MEHDDPAVVVRSLRLGLDLGRLHVDTAELYGAGRVEELVGEALLGRREGVFLVSKVLPQNASRSGTRAACERSLKRLRTDHLDCYLLHWPGHHPLEGTLEAFEDLAREGKILSYGVSNFDDEELERAVALAGPGRIACNQILYHLGQRSSEHRVIPTAEAYGVAIVGYTPFGRAAFPPLSGGAALQRIAERHGATARQVVLSFLTRRSSLFAIPKASTEAHVRENAGAAGLLLTTDDLAEIEEAFPVGPPRPGVARI